MNKSISKIILSLMIIFFLTISFSCSNPSSDNSTANPTSQPTPNNPPAPTPDPEVYYTISFNKNNESATGSTASIKAKADSIVSLTANGFALEGYTFTGWNTKADGTGTGYDDGSSLKLTGDMSLYAQWSSAAVPTYQISIPAVVGGTVSVNKTFAEAGSEIELTIIPDDLYAFDSIKVKDSENNPIQISKNQSNNYTFIMPGKNVTVDAKFIYVAHTVSIVPGENGTASVNKIKAVAGNEVTITVQPNENYVLNTISVKETSGASIDIIQSQINPKLYTFYMPDKDVVVSVTYKERSYTIRFITDCSIQIPSQTVERNGKAKYVSMSDNSECSGFLGWYIEPECINKFDFDNSAIIQDVALYAKWESFIFTSENIVQIISTLLYSCNLKCWIDYNHFNNEIYMEKFDINKIHEITTALQSLYSKNPTLMISLDFRCSVMTENYSFKDCKNIECIYLPGTKLGVESFRGCVNLREVNGVNGDSDVGDYAFYGCTALKFLNKGSNGDIELDRFGNIGKYAFYGCSDIESIVYSPSIKYTSWKIGEYAFYGCSSLKRASLSATEIEQYAFSHCTSLSDLSFSVNELKNNAFEYCSSLSNIQFSGYLENIGDYAFANCTSLKKISFMPQYDRKGNEIHGSNKIKNIGQYAFYNCNLLSELDFGSDVQNLEEIGEYAFTKCGIQKAIIPHSVKFIKEGAFRDCTNLRQVQFSLDNGYGINQECAELLSVGEYAFYGCSSLQFFDIYKSGEISKRCRKLQSYGAYAFANTKIQSIWIYKNQTEICANAFMNCPLKKAFFDAFGWIINENIEPEPTSLYAGHAEECAKLLTETYVDYKWVRKNE